MKTEQELREQLAGEQKELARLQQELTEIAAQVNMKTGLIGGIKFALGELTQTIQERKPTMRELFEAAEKENKLMSAAEFESWRAKMDAEVAQDVGTTLD